MSRRALRISPGVSSRSVADWNRSWNRCFSMSRRVRASCSSLIPRYSAAFGALAMVIPQTACRFTNRHLNGILYATRARQSLAAGSGRPPISNSIMPGLTTAAQYSGSPLPLPIRVSAGMDVTDLCGNTRMYRRPSPRMNWATVTRPASRASADSHPPSNDCRPNSPKATVLPRLALPWTRPRCVFRYFTRLGICGMGRLLRARLRLAAKRWLLAPLAAALVAVAARAAAAAGSGRARGLGDRRLLGQVIPVVHPHLDADVPLGRGRLGETVVHLRPQGGQRDAALHRLLAPGHFRPAQPAGQLQLDPPGPGVHALFHRLLHGPPEASPLLELLGDLLGDDLRVRLRPTDFHRLDLDHPPGQVLEQLGQLVDVRPLLADDHADLGRVDRNDHLLPRPVDADLRDLRPLLAEQ